MLRISCNWSTLSCSVTASGAVDTKQLSVVNFHRQLDKGSFQEIQTFAKKIPSLFNSTYLREQTFTVMNFNKKRVRARLVTHLRDILHVKTTAFEPDLAYLLHSRSQSHPPHWCQRGI